MSAAENEAPDTLVDLLAWRVRQSPSSPACWQREGDGCWRSLDWNGLAFRVDRLARHLRSAGLRSGDAVGVLGRTSQWWLEAEFAVLRAGGVVVGLDVHAPAERTAALSDATACQWIVAEPGIDLEPVGVLAEHPPVHLDLPDADADRRSIPDVALPNVAPDDAAAVFFTSGTTGSPKVIRYTHAQLLAGCRAVARRHAELGPGDRVAAWLPMSALFQRTIDYVAIDRGVPLWFVEDPRTIVERLAEIRATVFVGVPRFFEKVHAAIEQRLETLPRPIHRIAVAYLRRGAARAEGISPRSTVGNRFCDVLIERLLVPRLRRVLGGAVRYAITGSAATPRETLGFFHALGMPLLEAYGVTENTIPIASNTRGAYRLGSVGTPLPEVELRLDVDGELLVRSFGLFAGYEGAADADDSPFTADGFYRTGDLGRLDADGFLHLTGRKNDVFKTSTGRKIAPRRIEAVYEQSPFVESIVVVGRGRPYPVALIVPNWERVRREFGLTNGHAMPNEAVAALPPVRELLDAELARLGGELADRDRVRRFAVLPRSFSPRTGELTTTLKVRRDAVAEIHADVIEELYDGSRSLDLERQPQRVLEPVG